MVFLSLISVICPAFIQSIDDLKDYISGHARIIMPIPISRPVIGEEEIRAVTEVLKSGNLVQGRKVEQFEAEFSRFIGAKFAAAVSSGTAALQIGLQALGLKRGTM
jgi:dTDP-4-amino-4,6-dideoxygalactose transaminase